jgi:hypothetical protein
VLRQTFEYGCYLRWRLAFAKHNLGHPYSQRSMMINFCEAEVFKWQVTKPLNGIVRRRFSPTHFFE